MFQLFLKTIKTYTPKFFSFFLSFLCVYVCVCVSEWERERVSERESATLIWIFSRATEHLLNLIFGKLEVTTSGGDVTWLPIWRPVDVDSTFDFERFRHIFDRDNVEPISFPVCSFAEFDSTFDLDCCRRIFGVVLTIFGVATIKVGLSLCG